MTNKEYLQIELRYSVQEYGENDPVTLGIKRQLKEMQEFSGEDPQILCFQTGFRNATSPKNTQA